MLPVPARRLQCGRGYGTLDLCGARRDSAQMPVGFEHPRHMTEFERTMRLAASEGDAAPEAPRRSDEGDLHEKASAVWAIEATDVGARATRPRSLRSQPASAATPLCHGIGGRKPSSRMAKRVSET